MYKVTKHIEVAGAHKLNLPYESKCSSLHGHNWHIWIEVCSKKLNKSGMVLDFAHINKYIKEKLDHKNVNEVFPKINPTAENIAYEIKEYLQHLANLNATDTYKPVVTKVIVQESDGNKAEWSIK